MKSSDSAHFKRGIGMKEANLYISGKTVEGTLGNKLVTNN